MSSTRRSVLLRRRLLGIVGTGVLVAACGGESTGTPSSGGAAGSGGLAGSGGAAGAGATGVGGSPSDAGSDGPPLECFSDSDLADWCTPAPDAAYTPWSCWTGDAGPWLPGTNTGCPQSILPNNGANCSKYTFEAMQNAECCYVFYPGGGGCGRPFLVGGEARRAAASARADWLDLPADSLEIDEATREVLAAAWRADALLEHASVASFARFTLELLALGAPADLLADAQRAAADEVEHARVCFGLASRYAGAALGPGPLSMDGSLGVVSLADAAARAAREGCVGETLAALVAGEQLERAADARVRAALTRIADDEAAHAELSWRFVTWAIRRGGEPVRRAVVTALNAAMAAERARPAAPESDANPDVLHAHGRLTSAEQRAAELAALRDVVEPCLRQLMTTGSTVDVALSA